MKPMPTNTYLSKCGPQVEKQIEKELRLHG